MTRGRADIEANPRLREPGRAVRFVQGDALTLPFADDGFDCATSGFTLRNVTDVRQAVAELRRVVRPGGRVVILEASQPPLAPIRIGHRAYIRAALPLLGWLIAGDPDAYTLLAQLDGALLRRPRPRRSDARRRATQCPIQAAHVWQRRRACGDAISRTPHDQTGGPPETEWERALHARLA